MRHAHKEQQQRLSRLQKEHDQALANTTAALKVGWQCISSELKVYSGRLCASPLGQKLLPT